MEKIADACYPITELLQKRWSPRAFSERAVSVEALRSLFEAVRWAPSCFNEQPWRYLVATRDSETGFAQMLGCLVEKNQRWARGAPVLMISVGKKTFSHNGRVNPTWQHDVGLASAQLTVQATSMGLFVHQMAGIDRDRIRKTYGIPDDFEPVAGLALGYRGEADRLPPEFQEAERAPRSRKQIHEFIYSELWEKPAEATVETVGDTP